MKGKDASNLKVGYSDFTKLCRVSDPEDWGLGLSIREDGVYLKEPPVGLEPAEREALSAHPSGNLKDPLLSFPCTVDQLQFFLEEHGGYGSIDPFDMADWAVKKALAVDIANAEAALGPRQETTYLNIIGGLIELMLGESPAGNKLSAYQNAAAIIDALLIRYEKAPGMSKRNLETKFANAKNSVSGV